MTIVPRQVISCCFGRAKPKRCKNSTNTDAYFRQTPPLHSSSSSRHRPQAPACPRRAPLPTQHTPWTTPQPARAPPGQTRGPSTPGSRGGRPAVGWVPSKSWHAKITLWTVGQGESKIVHRLGFAQIRSSPLYAPSPSHPSPPMSILPSPPHPAFSPEPAFPHHYHHRQLEANMKTALASSWRVLEQVSRALQPPDGPVSHATPLRSRHRPVCARSWRHTKPEATATERCSSPC